MLGASGMLGSAVFRVLSEDKRLKVFGTVRDEVSKKLIGATLSDMVLAGVNVEQQDLLINVFNRVCPEVVINCVGLIKQLSRVIDPLQAIPINSLLPHQLSYLCEMGGARLIHISTDCVFDGRKGGYTESDCFDAKDLYGLSKYLGEVSGSHAITLRTSIIGHELKCPQSLVDWFLSQKKRCNGYTKAVFSGLPTVVLSQIIRDIVIPRKELSGLYHIAAKPISKYELLKLIAKTYGKSVHITPDDSLDINRSLNADKFTNATGYVSPEWPDLIRIMHDYG